MVNELLPTPVYTKEFRTRTPHLYKKKKKIGANVFQKTVTMLVVPICMTGLRLLPERKYVILTGREEKGS